MENERGSGSEAAPSGKRKTTPARPPTSTVPGTSRFKRVRFKRADQEDEGPSVQRPLQPSTVREILFQLAESAANDRDSLGGPVVVRATADPEDTSALRRKSFAQRGKRGSTLARQNILSLPHPDIPVELYYKHIEATAPPPHRMSQLLAWSAKKVEPIIPEAVAERYGDLITEIQENVVRDVLSSKINTSWYGNKKTAEYGSEPHPRNIHDRKKLEEDEKAISELSRESDRWSELLHHYNKAHAEAVDAQILRKVSGVESGAGGDAEGEDRNDGDDADAVLERFTKISVQIDRVRNDILRAEAYTEDAEAMCEDRMRCILDALDARRGEKVTDIRQLLQR